MLFREVGSTQAQRVRLMTFNLRVPSFSTMPDTQHCHFPSPKCLTTAQMPSAEALEACLSAPRQLCGGSLAAKPLGAVELQNTAITGK